MLLLYLSCTRVVDLGSTGVCLKTPAACLVAGATCEWPAPMQSGAIDPASRITSVLFSAQAGPTAAAGPGATLVGWNRGSCAVYRGYWSDSSCGLLTTQVQVNNTVALAKTGGCTPDDFFDATASWNGEVFVIVGSAREPDGSYDLYAGRYSPEGRPLDSACLRLTSGPQLESAPAVAPVPGGFLVLWVDSDARVLGTRVGSDGTSAPFPAPLSLRAETSEPPALASNGGGLLAAWVDVVPMPARSAALHLIVTPLDFQGALTGPATFVAETGGSTEPGIASDGTNYLLVWSDHRESDYAQFPRILTTRIYASRVTPTGSVQDVGGFKVSSKAPLGVSSLQHHVRVAFDGAAYHVLWLDSLLDEPFNNTLSGTRVRPDGTRVSPDAVLATRVRYDRFALTAGLGRAHVFFAQNEEVWRAMLVEGQLDESSRLRVSRGLNSQYFPRLSVTSSRHLLAVWNEQRLADVNQSVGTTGLFGLRLDAELQPVDAQPFVVTELALPHEFDVASDGTDHLAVWQQQKAVGGPVEVRSVKLSTGTGAQSSPAVVATLSEAARNPSLCFDGSQWQLWFLEQNQLFVLRLASDGSGLEAPQLVADATHDFRLSRSAGCVGVGVGVVDGALVRVEVTSDGAHRLRPIDGVAITGSGRLAVAGSAGALFVAWLQPSGETAPLEWRLLDGSGAVVTRGGPELAFRPNDQLVATATDEGAMVFGFGSTEGRTRLVRFSPAGYRLGPVVELNQQSRWLSAVALPRGGVPMAVTSFDKAAQAQRLSLEMLEWRSVGAPCTADNQCASNTCGLAN